MTTTPPLRARGALSGLARALSFLVHAVSYLASTLVLLAMRTPFEEEREVDRSPLRGLALPLGSPLPADDRVPFGLANFVGLGVLFAIVVIAEREGLSGGRIGLLVAAFGAGVLVGSFLSPVLRRLLPVRGVLLLELWTWVGCGAFVIWADVHVLAASLVPSALAIPSTDSVVRSLQLALTPTGSSAGSRACASRSRSSSRRSAAP